VENFGRDLIFFCVFLIYITSSLLEKGRRRKKKNIVWLIMSLIFPSEERSKGEKDIKASALQT